MNWLQLQCHLFQDRVNWQFAQWLHKKFSNPAELSPHPDYDGNHFFPFRSGSQFQFSIPVPSCAAAEKGNIFHDSLATLAPLPESHTPEAAGQLLFYTFLIRFLPAGVWMLGVWLPGVQSCKSRMKFIEYLSKKKYFTSHRNWNLSRSCHPCWPHVLFLGFWIFLRRFLCSIEANSVEMQGIGILYNLFSGL